MLEGANNMKGWASDMSSCVKRNAPDGQTAGCFLSAPRVAPFCALLIGCAPVICWYLTQERRHTICLLKTSFRGKECPFTYDVFLAAAMFPKAGYARRV